MAYKKDLLFNYIKFNILESQNQEEILKKITFDKIIIMCYYLSITKMYPRLG